MIAPAFLASIVTAPAFTVGAAGSIWYSVSERVTVSAATLAAGEATAEAVTDGGADGTDGAGEVGAADGADGRAAEHAPTTMVRLTITPRGAIGRRPHPSPGLRRLT